MAYEHGFKGFHQIGVTDIANEGKYTYSSNNQPINFDPIWVPYNSYVDYSYGSRGPSYNCIATALFNPDDTYYAKWIDTKCKLKKSTICWSIN